MSFAVLAFVAGILTILAPCILPLLPVVIGGSITGKNWWRPLVVVTSFLVTMLLVTIGVKLFADQVSISTGFWKYISGVTFFFFGLTLLVPTLWGRLSARFSLQTRTLSLLHRYLLGKNFVALVLLGVILVPVFVSCSPTYLLILGVILPQQFWVGLWYLFLYLFGISLMLFGIGFLGQRLYLFFGKLAAPHGLFKKIMGIILILFAFLVVTGYQLKLESWILDMGWAGVTEFEFNAVDRFKER